MTATARPVSELSFNQLLAADITFGPDDGAGEVLYRDGITGREMEPGELVNVPGDPEPEIEP